MKKSVIIVLISIFMVTVLTIGVVLFINNTDGKKYAHDYVETIVGATCVDGGYTLHKCSCGEEYKDNEVAPLVHNYTDISYAWDNAYTKCIATAICGRGICKNTYSLPSSNIVFEIIKKATCNEVGERKYTATFSDDIFLVKKKVS